MAARAAPHRRTGQTGQFVRAAVVGLLAVAVTVSLALWVLGYLGAPAAAAGRQYAVQYPAEPRPTPYWPFREEWLTPRPKG